jgi:hypothetical protein
MFPTIMPWPMTACKTIQECELGNKIYHKKTKTMAFKLPNGQKAKTDKKT